MSVNPDGTNEDGGGGQDDDALKHDPGADADGPLVAHELSAALEEEIDEYVTWQKNAPFIYEHYLSAWLDWPALTVSWLPDQPGEPPRFAIGTNTEKGHAESPELVVFELQYARAERMDMADPWYEYKEVGVGQHVHGFGNCLPDGVDAPLRVVGRWKHEKEVNRLAPCPHHVRLVATRAASGTVSVIDTTTQDHADAVATLQCPESMVEGFGLAWSRTKGKTLLASGGEDGYMCVWDMEALDKATAQTSSASKAPVRRWQAHEKALCDLCFSTTSSDLLASVGDADRELRLWDLRISTAVQSKVEASREEVISVDWNYHNEFLLATTGKDAIVHVWDTRSLKCPVRSLAGHAKQGVAVRWAPFQESLLASASDDQSVIIWDLDAKAEPAGADAGSEEDPPEVFFQHNGHTAGGVADVSWCGGEEFLLCSCGEGDNTIQVWQPNNDFYQPDSDNEGENGSEPATKKARVESSELFG